jgi:hypothetical protein
MRYTACRVRRVLGALTHACVPTALRSSAVGLTRLRHGRSPRSGIAAGRPSARGVKLANSTGRSNVLHKTYAPVEIEAVRNTDEARLQGRRKMRARNESGAKVSTQQPGLIHRPSPIPAKPLK